MSTSNIGLSSPNPVQCGHPSPSPIQQRISRLEKDIALLESELSGKNPDEITATHIKRLHTYNEIKDTTQALIGKLAVLNNTTIRAVHEDLGLPLID
ncbi:Swi5-domain-containing protein [Naematelia encephala]|uniref:Swi5-domain-containing protein n=1 Tax=Naematelia encephala TaxID=71784 RepID=A0A1Y2BK95_9TREE|nr:Swi5-domain-containing protein [Naematelia encephala]